MSYYDLTPEQLAEIGADYDLGACLEYNPQSFKIEDIAKVLAVIEGENDEKDWHWVLLLKGKTFVYLVGGCDYTGWDCQSFAESFTLSQDLPLDKVVKDADTLKELQRQLNEGKATTWREEADKKFGLINK